MNICYSTQYFIFSFHKKSGCAKQHKVLFSFCRFKYKQATEEIAKQLGAEMRDRVAEGGRGKVALKTFIDLPSQDDESISTIVRWFESFLKQINIAVGGVN